MKHAILGAGAIGGLMATALASLGDDVILLVRREKQPSYPKTLLLEHPAGKLNAPVRTAVRLTEPVDVLWIATKSYDLDSALDSVEAAPRRIVPLLNGIDHVALLRARFGYDAVVPATIAVEAERVREGHFVHHTPVRLFIASSGEAILGQTMARLKEMGFNGGFVPNEHTLLWSKLCFLGPFALVTAASGKNLGEILNDAEWKSKLDSALAEARAVAEAEGAQIDAERIHAIFAMAPPTMRASMAKDLAAGRRLELDAIAGPIVRGGLRHGIAVPTSADLIAQIQARQQRR